MKEHHYKVNVIWTGNRGSGTTGYTDYDRHHTIVIEGKPDLPGSSDAPFMGDVSRHNPEDMMVASLSTCHMLWYLHLCADAGIVVTDYSDHAEGVMVQVAGGGGYFASVVLHPRVTITDPAMVDKANALHDAAHDKCFIANSVRFPVTHIPVCSADQITGLL
jgi:organic hydroperoxide reductase OsmC/OhrA